MSLFAQSASASWSVSANMGGKRSAVVTLEVFTLGPNRPTSNGVSVAPAMIVAPFFKQQSFKVLGAGAELMGNFLALDLQEVDPIDKANKRGLKQRANRTPCAQKCVLQLGSVISLSQHKMVDLMPHHIYSVSISAVDIDDYVGAKSLKFTLDGPIKHVRGFEKMSPSEHDWMLLSFQAAGLVNDPLVHPTYNDKATAMVSGMNDEQMKNFKKDKNHKAYEIYTPSTCAMRNSALVFPRLHGIRRGEDYFANALVQCGMRSGYWKEPALELSTDDAWPRMLLREGATTAEKVDFMKFALGGEQYVPRKGVKPKLPVSDAETFRAIYDHADVEVVVLAGTSAVMGYGVMDPRHTMGRELRALIYHTPSLYRTYMAPATNYNTVQPSPESKISISVSSSGGKPKPGQSVDTTGVLVDLAVGIVNAGYPVTGKHAVELMKVLATREPERYAVDMSKFRNGLPDSEGMPIAPNPLNKALTNQIIINLLEYNHNVAELKDDEWSFFVIPNGGAKSSEKPDKDAPAGTPDIESLGFQYFRQQHQALGEQGVAQKMGDLFVNIANDDLDEVEKSARQAFHKSIPKDVGEFRFLLFAVSNNYIEERALTPLSTTNHKTIIDNYARELFPEDGSKLAHVDAWYYPYSYEEDKKRKGSESATPSAKTIVPPSSGKSSSQDSAMPDAQAPPSGQKDGDEISDADLVGVSMQ